MQKRFPLAMLFLVGGLWLAGCATGTSTQAPVDDGSSTGSSGQPVPPSGAPQGESMSGSAADATLVAKRRVYFAFDASQLDEENRRIVEAHARNMNANSNLRVHLEGHTDERGTREYNMALGERRAQAVERILRVLNVASNRVTKVSYGEEKPVAPGHNEAAWSQNRRVEIVYR